MRYPNPVLLTHAEAFGFKTMINMKKYTIYTLLLLCCMQWVACSSTQSLSNDKNWAFQPIEKLDDANPVMESDRKAEFFCPLRKKNVRWEEQSVFNPAAVVKDGRVWLLYRAQDDVDAEHRTSRIGLASSRDGLEFKKLSYPVMFPNRDKMKDFEWEGGCEDPRVVKRADGKYIMTYTAYDGKVARLAIASSTDLQVWEKHGLAFDSKRYKNQWSKSGAIVCENINGEIVAAKINGKYWMYWGDTNIFLATSEDLIEWKPIEMKGSDVLRIALQPRPGKFDSELVEPGPFALLTPKGILLFYNSANAPTNGDTQLPAMAYSVGQALFDAAHPEKLKARSNQHFLHPEKAYEKKGQVNNVCFLEGMVWWKDQWLLYYGTADSKIAVAACKPK
jgi:predicted GH43/DUF377 family glycosyl hydrolase